MPLADLSTLDIVWIALSVFLIVVGLGLGLVLFNLSGTVRRLTSFIQGLEKEVLPVIAKAGGTVDRVNAQLDKVDPVTDSAVDAADRVDTAVRAVSLAITRPVQKLSGLFEGIAHHRRVPRSFGVGFAKIRLVGVVRFELLGHDTDDNSAAHYG